MAELRLDLRVRGVPATGGSKRAFVHPTARTKRGKPKVVVVDDCRRNKPWRDLIVAELAGAWRGAPLTGPLLVEAEFRLPRPKAHYGTGRNEGVLKGSAPVWHSVRPDATKLWRPAEDAMTGVVWKDDASIVKQLVTKRYVTATEPPGLRVRVYAL